MTASFVKPFVRQRILASVATLLTFGAVITAAESARNSAQVIIVERLKAARPDLPTPTVTPAALEGFYQVEFPSGELLYATADGRYLFADMWEVQEKALVNLTELRRNAVRRELLAQLKPEDAVSFAPPGGTRAVVNVFTDVDCGYCQRLHQDMPGYHALGIEIRYLAYPRAGMDSPTAAKLVTAWCSEDRQDALTRLKRQEVLPARSCDSPVEEEYELGQRMGVSGTPALLLADGRLLPGYMPPAELARVLGLDDPVQPSPAPHG